MRQSARLLLVVVCAIAAGSTLALAQARAFGFGGPMGMTFFPNMTGINTFMSENGLDSMGTFLIGAGGCGRGGVIGGPALGGIGWGLVAASEGEDRSAELVSAGGGFDLGAAIGGDDNSVLTIGAVLGGGANLLSVTGYLVETTTPQGLIPEPLTREVGLAMGFVQPYVSMAAQLLPWMGFELRIGYLFPVVGLEFGDLLGIPAPSLDLSGPTVSFGITFGGIVSPKDEEPEDLDEPVTEVSGGSFDLQPYQQLVLENMIGDVTVTAYEIDPVQTPEMTVTWQAVRTARRKDIDALDVRQESGEYSQTLKTVGAGRVDYVLQMPSGVDLSVRNGTGDVRVSGHQAPTIIVENGVGDITLEDVEATALILAGGVGQVDLRRTGADTLIADLGLGDLRVGLPVSISARLSARASLGNVSLDRFPAMIGGVRGFLGKTADVTMGLGERRIELNVGLGRIDIYIELP